MRSRAGNAIAQYGIVIGLVALAVIPVFFMLGSSIVKEFSNFSSGFTSPANTGVELSGIPGIPGGNSGTGSSAGLAVNKKIPSSNAGADCSGNSCKIDFGDFVLDGVPENFDNFMESTASSGGTETLADLLMALSKSPELSKEEKDIIERLANAGHDIAADERYLEDNVLASMETSLPIGFEQNIPLDKISSSSENFQKFDALLSSLATIKGNTSDPELLKVFNSVNVLTDEIKDIRRDLYNQAIGIKDLVNAEASAMDINDQIMGVVSGYSADRTDLDSVFVCIAGSGKDGGQHCN